MNVNIVSFARETLNASACAAKLAHAALALPLPLFRALAAEYTRLANSGEYAAVRRTLAHQSNALRQGCQSHADLNPNAKGNDYAHCIRADRTGLGKGEYRFVVAEYARDTVKAAAASAKAGKSASVTASATPAAARATSKTDALIAELRAKLAKAESERDAARAESAKLRTELEKAAQTIVALNATPAKPATPAKVAANA